MTIVTLTDAAVAHINSMLSKEKTAVGFRLSIKKTGCSGYAYVPDLIVKIKENDIHFVVQDGLNIYIDPECVSFITGVIIDYVADNMTGLKQKRLVFINPNEKN